MSGLVSSVPHTLPLDYLEAHLINALVCISKDNYIPFLTTENTMITPQILTVILISGHSLFSIQIFPVVSQRYFPKLICLNRDPDKAHALYLVDMSLVFKKFFEI